MKIKNIQCLVCLGMLFVLVCQARAQDWIYFDTAFSGDMYYDKSSIKKTGDGVFSVRTKNTLNEFGKSKYYAILKSLNKAPDNPASLSYSVTVMEINYADNKIRDTSLFFHDEQDQIVYSSPQNDSGEWNAIKPGTIGDKLFNLVSWEADISTRRVDQPEIHKAPLPEKPPAAPAAASGKKAGGTGGNKHQKKEAPQKAIRHLVNKWVASWESGNMETYRSCYAPDFEGKGMNLDQWIAYKTDVALKSEKIKIRIDRLRISVNGNDAKAQFQQHYSSSLLKTSVRKTLDFIKTDNGWKIYREYL